MNDRLKCKAPVAVIILNWNGAAMMDKYLPSVVRYTPAEIGEVIVADNGSTDDSLPMLDERFPSVRTVRFEQNYGFAEGYNRAIEAVEAEYVVLLNSDVEVKDDWLTPLYRFMTDNSDIGACQPKIRSLTDPERFEYAGAAGGYLDCNGYPYCRGRIFDTVETDRGQYDTRSGETSPDLFWATGAALMVRRSLYLEAGGLDPRFFAHMEEIDLCWRIRLAGYKIGVATGSTVYHLGGGSLPAGNPRKTYLNFRNNLLMMHKNLPDATRGRKLLRRRLLDTVAWLKFVATFDFANAGAVWRAHRDFRTMSREYTEHPDVDLLDSSAGANVNILVEYWIRRHRTAAEINR